MSSSGAEVTRDELSATLEARRELGRDYEPALVDALAERVEQVVQARVAAHTGPVPAGQQGPTVFNYSSGVMPWPGRLAVALGSLVFAIPCSAIAGDVGGLAGVAITWAGIAIVNVAVAVGPRARR